MGEGLRALRDALLAIAHRVVADAAAEAVNRQDVRWAVAQAAFQDATVVVARDARGAEPQAQPARLAGARPGLERRARRVLQRAELKLRVLVLLLGLEQRESRV